MLPFNDPAGASGPFNAGEQPQIPGLPPDLSQPGEQSQMLTAADTQAQMTPLPAGPTPQPVHSKRGRIISIVLLALVVLGILTAIGGGALLVTAHVVVPPAYQSDQGIVHFYGTQVSLSSAQQPSTNLTVVGIEGQSGSKFYFFHQEEFPSAPGFALEQNISLLYRPDEIFDITDFLASVNLQVADGVSPIAAKIVQVTVDGQVYNSSEYLTAQGRPLVGYVLLPSGLGVALIAAVVLFIVRRRVRRAALAEPGAGVVALAASDAPVQMLAPPAAAAPPDAASQAPAAPAWLPPAGTEPTLPAGAAPLVSTPFPTLTGAGSGSPVPPWPPSSGPLPPPAPTPGMSGALADEPTIVGSQPWLSAPVSGPMPLAPAAPAWPSASGPIFSPSGPPPWPPALAPQPAPDTGSRVPATSRWLLTAALFGLALVVLGGVLFVITPASSASVHGDALTTAGGLAALIAGLALIALPFALRFWRGRSGKRSQTDAGGALVGVAVGTGVPASQPPEAEAGD